MRYVVYDPATGTILRTGTCAENEVALQPQPGERACVDTTGEARDSTHKVVLVAGHPQIKRAVQ